MGSKQSTTAENKPPEWAAPLFKQSASEAGRLYDSGMGGRAYTGQGVAPQSGATQAGINNQFNAGNAWDTSGTRNLFGGIGANAVGASNIGTVSGTNLGEMASGKWLKEGNPYFNDRLEGQLADTAAQTRSLASGMGRYGSDVSNRVLTDRLGGLRTEALAQDWDRNLGAMLGANQQIDSSNAQNVSNRLSGLGLAQNAATSMAGLDQQNFQNRLAGAGAQREAGQAIDQHAQNQLADYEAMWREMDNEGWNRLGLLQSAASGAAGPYGTQTSRTKSSNPGAILGAALGGMGGK